MDNNRPLFIPVILGTARMGRMSLHAARVITEELSKRNGVETDIVAFAGTALGRREDIRKSSPRAIVRPRFAIKSRKFKGLHTNKMIRVAKSEDLHDGNNDTYYGNLAFTKNPQRDLLSRRLTFQPEEIEMVSLGVFVRLEAKPGKEREVAAFLIFTRNA